MDRIDQAVELYPNAGSMESGRRSAVTRSVPPRWAPSVRATVVTQRSSPVSAIPVGADPVTIVGVAAGPDPSCQIVPSSALATQTSSEATAMACGSRPAGIVSDTAVAPAATNEAVPSDRFVTQTPPSTDATPLGSVPTWMVEVTRWESASITETVPSVLLATQTFSPSLVMADGNPPTSIGRSAMPRTGSRRCTVPSMLLATQMPLEDAATAMGPLPTAIVCTTLSDVGIICDTVRASAFATHTASSPIARLSGSLPTSIVSTTASDDGSILETVPSEAFATHTASSVATTALGRLPTGIADLSRPLAGSKRPRLFGATVVSPTPRTLGTTIAVATSASAAIAADATRSRFRRGVSGAILPRRCRASSASSGADLGVPSTAVAAKTRHASSTPFSWRIPRSSNRKPAPRESSAAVLETSTSPAPPSAMMRAPTTTVIPPSFLPIRSHSPKWTPARISTPRSRTASAIEQAQVIAGAGSLKLAKKPSPAVSSSVPPKRLSSRRTIRWWASTRAFQRRSPSSSAIAVLSTMSVNRTAASVLPRCCMEGV